MKILVVTHSYPRPSCDSAGIFIHRLNVGLGALGHEVHVLQMDEWAPRQPFASLLGSWRRAFDRSRDSFQSLDSVPIHHPTWVRPRPSRVFRTEPIELQVRGLVRYCTRTIALAEPDIILGHFLVPDGYHALGLARALDAPVAAMGWGIDVDEWPKNDLRLRTRLRDVLQDTNALVACSRQMIEDANRWLEVPRDDWNVVYAGVDLRAFHPTTDTTSERRELFAAFPALCDPATKIVLMVARPVRLKGYVEALDAWARVERDRLDWHLVMTGIATGDLDIPSEITRRALDGRAHWLGPRPVGDMPGLLRASDLFLLPSHYEGLSISVMEAMATGLPVVTTDVGGHREIVTHGENGWLLKAKDGEAVAAALKQATGSPQERLRRGAAARLSAERVGTPEKNAARLSEILERHALRPSRARLA